ncbi:MAG TPA: TraB/GumN family protein [Allosphingosinicella sp.]|jgi:uncharacterized protein YbaP (TraB family)|nr:TraB/GumN family protein [Allosphingosinicella sp.]
MRIEGVKGLLAALGVSVTLASAAQAAAPQSAPTQRAAAAACTGEPAPAIWVVEDRDTKIFLFGTTHAFEHGFCWRSRPLELAIRDSQELVVEVAEDQAAHDAAWERLSALERPVPILERVSPGRRAALRRLIARSGLPIEQWDRLQTLAAVTLLGNVNFAAARQAVLGETLQEAGGETAMSGAEIELIELFRWLGLPVTGLQTAAEQMEDFARFSPRAQRDLLDAAVDAAVAVSAPAAGDEVWARGDMRTIERDLQRMTPALREAMVTRRNRSWAEWIAARMERPGTLMFAVGVSHFAGADSLQNMLAARGLRARRID